MSMDNSVPCTSDHTHDIEGLRAGLPPSAQYLMPEVAAPCQAHLVVVLIVLCSTAVVFPSVLQLLEVLLQELLRPLVCLCITDSVSHVALLPFSKSNERNG